MCLVCIVQKLPVVVGEGVAVVEAAEEGMKLVVVLVE